MVTHTAHALPAQAIATMADFVAAGGTRGLEAARRLGPDGVIDEITAAGLRGRGGAGFPTGIKWRSLRDGTDPGDDTFVVINAAEGEPGTFKDRALLRRNPYLVLEGALIAARTLGATHVVLATKARYTAEIAAVERATREFADAGLSDGIDVSIVGGPDHYLFGEETALLEVVEGEEPLPRHLPPYHYGLFTTSPQLGWSAGTDASTTGPTMLSSNPALVNNVETYAHVALVCRHGADWYRSMGTPESPGPTIVTISGDVERAIVAEISLGAPLAEAIDELAGGVRGGRAVKAVFSGVANPVLPADRIDAPISYEGMAAAGAGMGSAGFIVYDDTRNIVDVAYRLSMFLYVESCGQCNPCKTGTQAITAALERIVTGRGDDAAIDAIRSRLRTVTDASRCYLPTQEQRLVASVFEHFPDDVEERLRGVRGDLDIPIPKLADIADGVAVLDEQAAHKRPDWTYAETVVRLG